MDDEASGSDDHMHVCMFYKNEFYLSKYNNRNLYLFYTTIHSQFILFTSH